MEAVGITRKALGQYHGKTRPVRFKFLGTLATVSVGVQDGYVGKTVLVRDVMMTSYKPWILVADHTWLLLPGEFMVPRHLPKDTEVTFTGVVRKYARRTGEIDYGLGEIEDFVITGPPV